MHLNGKNCYVICRANLLENGQMREDLLSKNLPLIMVFRRKFLYGGRQKNYFNVKILILVCPNRTCKIFENR